VIPGGGESQAGQAQALHGELEQLGDLSRQAEAGGVLAWQLRRRSLKRRARVAHGQPVHVEQLACLHRPPLDDEVDEQVLGVVGVAVQAHPLAARRGRAERHAELPVPPTLEERQNPKRKSPYSRLSTV